LNLQKLAHEAYKADCNSIMGSRLVLPEVQESS